MDALKHKAHSLFKGVAEKVMPTLKESAFKEKGVLTPEEFVLAGDNLCQTCPTWRWEGGAASKRYTFLPADKQYLVTTYVWGRGWRDKRPGLTHQSAYNLMSLLLCHTNPPHTGTSLASGVHPPWRSLT